MYPCGWSSLVGKRNTRALLSPLSSVRLPFSAFLTVGAAGLTCGAKTSVSHIPTRSSAGDGTDVTRRPPCDPLACAPECFPPIWGGSPAGRASSRVCTSGGDAEIDFGFHMLTPAPVRKSCAPSRHTPFGAGVLRLGSPIDGGATGGVGVAVRRFGRSGLCELGLNVPGPTGLGVWPSTGGWPRLPPS